MLRLDLQSLRQDYQIAMWRTKVCFDSFRISLVALIGHEFTIIQWAQPVFRYAASGQSIAFIASRCGYKRSDSFGIWN